MICFTMCQLLLKAPLPLIRQWPQQSLLGSRINCPQSLEYKGALMVLLIVSVFTINGNFEVRVSNSR